MLYVQVVVTLSLVLFCSALDYTPVLYPGPCPHVPPSARFNQRQLVRQWHATHFSNPSFRGIRCATNNITETSNGVQFNSKFLNASGQQETYISQLNSTQNPGVYDVSYLTPNGTNVNGKQVLYLYEPNENSESHESHESHEQHGKNLYLFTWACIEKPAHNKHVECAGIQSNYKSASLAAVQAFQRHLNSHGSPIEQFYQADNNNC